MALVWSWVCLGRVWGGLGEVLGVFFGGSGKVCLSSGDHFGTKKSIKKRCDFRMHFFACMFEVFGGFWIYFRKLLTSKIESRAEGMLLLNMCVSCKRELNFQGSRCSMLGR